MDKQAQKQPQQKRERFWPIVSGKLPTGQLVETLHRPNVPETVFVVGSHGETLELGKVPAPGGGWYVPYSHRNNLLRHRVVLLPSTVDEYQAEPILLALVRGFIRRYVDLSPDFEEIATHYVLFTWFYDDFNELPYLRVQGDYGSGKSRFLQTVGSLCYKPIFASGASTVSPLFRILDSVGGTLVIDEGDFRFSDEKAEIVKIFNNGNCRGFPVLRSEQQPSGEFNPRAFTVFGPKLIATRGPFEDRALESRCITEIMGTRQVRSDVPRNLSASFEEEALSIRNKLLLYRIRHAGEARDLDAVPTDRLEPRVAQVFAPLLATIGDPKARARVAGVARALSREMAGERSDSTEARVLAVALELQEAAEGPIHLQEICRRFREKHARLYGDSNSISPQWVGSVLRRLGFRPRKSHGTFALSPEDFPLLVKTAERYGLTATGDPGDEGDIPEDEDGESGGETRVLF